MMSPPSSDHKPHFPCVKPEDSIAGPELIAALHETNAQVRAHIVCALGSRKDAGAIEALVGIEERPLAVGKVGERRVLRETV